MTQSNVSTRNQIYRTPSLAQIDAALKACLDLQNDFVRTQSKPPFSALLLAPDNTTILSTCSNVSRVAHAESSLVLFASQQYNREYLAGCTLVTTWEPCCMCTGTIYWSNIGGVMFAASEDDLRDLTGEGDERNLTMNLPCREVLSRGQRDVFVVGPVDEWRDKVIEASREYWKALL